MPIVSPVCAVKKIINPLVFVRDSVTRRSQVTAPFPGACFLWRFVVCCGAHFLLAFSNFLLRGEEKLFRFKPSIGLVSQLC